ncbi:self-incompatibility protein S1-like [Cannabis sativa]|uniref:self-incompatibility protein S1-like n=1 Tax=Cannabis sativa TaxID=3483 RepID=UPI0029CA2E2F|nr:self-incompatibility protein S1-like [Cannabis sativa]
MGSMNIVEKSNYWLKKLIVLLVVFEVYMSINNKVLLVDATVVIDNEREVKVKVMNRLGYGDSMIVHCQSNYHDLPSVVIEDGREMEWIITGSNLLGVPLFHCEMQPKTSTIWYSFDGYDPQRDGGRCRTECRWMIPNNGALYGYDQRFSRWVWFPYSLKSS